MTVENLIDYESERLRDERFALDKLFELGHISWDNLPNDYDLENDEYPAFLFLKTQKYIESYVDRFVKNDYSNIEIYHVEQLVQLALNPVEEIKNRLSTHNAWITQVLEKTSGMGMDEFVLNSRFYENYVSDDYGQILEEVSEYFKLWSILLDIQLGKLETTDHFNLNIEEYHIYRNYGFIIDSQRFHYPRLCKKYQELLVKYSKNEENGNSEPTQVQEISSESAQLRWQGNRTDLYELIIALAKSGRIQTSEGEQIQIKQLAPVFDSIFENLDITAQKINDSVSKRYKNEFANSFLADSLQSHFIEEMKNIISEARKSRKDE